MEEEKSQAVEEWYNLAVCYCLGEGVDKDDREAARLYRLAADAGDSRAQYALGVYRDEKNDHGIEQDDREAARLYRLAADQGHPKAQCNLGILHAQGRGGVDRDIHKAMHLFRLAVAQGHEVAQDNLAKCHEIVQAHPHYLNGVQTNSQQSLGEALVGHSVVASVTRDLLTAVSPERNGGPGDPSEVKNDDIVTPSLSG